MARKPRPVDPADGPIPAFAYDLRKVREEAGNPTYRALATSAGFSATTLSDAAGGVRQPSLEVTLAYVGACGGDVRGWERRWYELDRELARERTGSATGAATAEEAAEETGKETPASTPVSPETPASSEGPELPPPTDGVSAGPGRLPPWAPWSIAATAVAVVVVLGLLAVRAAAPDRTSQPTAATVTSPACPPAGPPGSFSGTTYNANTLVRAGASLGTPVVFQAPSGCSLQFTGYCLGDVVIDITSGSPDMRWFRVSQGGVVSSAVIHGNPPSTMQPSECPDSVPAPAAVSLTVVRQPDESDTVELRSAGRYVAIVGYAAYFAPPGSSAQSPKWQQIGLTDTAAAGFAVAWRLGPLRVGVPADATVPVVAVACLGGGGPTTVTDARRIPLAAGDGQPAALDRAALTDADLVKAEQAACKFPQRG
ncbi:helix-turn-helix transcriptional regulator [Kitasatospora sp. GP82]|uniref:helix-turn-helix domain-containing protein n=1 Tax=Kitasatospora sp. GP82 TaxID=3035089 RepID=UPI00247602CF|nr:helix-turn-helix transcriptional regulator [Kitasatospora sp. GP82]MDH6124815.1 hypothetical protein [Kitasatospora sp. GP82]